MTGGPPGAAGEAWRRRHSISTVDGFGRPVDELAELVLFLFFSCFDLPSQAPNHLGKYGIYCDDRSDAVVVVCLEKSFLAASIILNLL